jgi:hypothetical protein
VVFEMWKNFAAAQRVAGPEVLNTLCIGTNLGEALCYLNGVKPEIQSASGRDLSVLG